MKLTVSESAQSRDCLNQFEDSFVAPSHDHLSQIGQLNYVQSSSFAVHTDLKARRPMLHILPFVFATTEADLGFPYIKLNSEVRQRMKQFLTSL